MFFYIMYVSNIHLIQMSYSPHLSTPAFHSPFHFAGPHIAFVNFTILNIHACFPFSYGWMVWGKTAENVCRCKSFLLPPPSASNGVFMSFRKWDLICIHIVLHVCGTFYSSSSENIKNENGEEYFCKISLYSNTHKHLSDCTESSWPVGYKHKQARKIGNSRP